MNRRDLLKLTALAPIAYSLSNYIESDSSLAKAAINKKNGVPFSHSNLLKYAKSLANKGYVHPQNSLPDSLKNLNYDDYRKIQFDADKAIWKQDRIPFQLQYFHTGFLYKHPIDIHVVEKGRATPLEYDPDLFRYGQDVSKPDLGNVSGISGFRIHTSISRSPYPEEFAVFQGASYFRSIAKNQTYGISARGLAINTGQAEGEEFPRFSKFWIEKPGKNSQKIVIYALLDSPSVVGVYRFTIWPGNNTNMLVKTTLYPRKTMKYVGIAPLTSMFLFGPNNQKRFDDFRPRVHDSEGLSIINGNGEQIWRPLINPKTLQFSAFMDRNPKGFGLMQRSRSFREYHDLEAKYHKRPSLWIEPTSEWGEGYVELIEIPTPQEIHDNIVAFWRPKKELQPGKTYRFDYKMSWCNEPEYSDKKASVVNLRSGKVSEHQKRFIVDFELPEKFPKEKIEDLKPDVSSASGSLSDVVLQTNLELNGMRLTYKFNTKDIGQTDIRTSLMMDDKPVSEVCVYRWET